MTDVPTICFAAIDMSEIVGIIVFFLYGLFWLFKRLAESKAPPSSAPDKTEEEPQEIVADEDEVRRFLQSIGARPAPPPQPAPPQPAQQPACPLRRPRHEPLAAPLQPQLAEQPTTRMLLQEQTPEGPQPALYQASTGSKLSLSQQEQPRAAELEHAKVRQLAVSIEERLAFPQFPPAQRAIVLSEIIPRRRGPHHFAQR